MQAVSEGNDPSAQSIVQFQNLITNGTVTVLVYNSQTVTPETQTIEALATQYDIPIVPITETVQPPTAIVPRLDEFAVNRSSNALNQQASGK